MVLILHTAGDFAFNPTTDSDTCYIVRYPNDGSVIFCTENIAKISYVSFYCGLICIRTTIAYILLLKLLILFIARKYRIARYIQSYICYMRMRSAGCCRNGDKCMECLVHNVQVFVLCIDDYRGRRASTSAFGR